jgi:hypothetical protein
MKMTYEKFLKEMHSQYDNWYRVNKNVSKLGKIFNEDSKKFLKAELVDSACAYCIDGFRYVDKKGFDHYYKKTYRVSGKASDDMFVTKAGYLKKEVTVDVHNPHTNTVKKIQPFDAMVMIQKTVCLGVGIIPFDKVESLVDMKAAKSVVKIPINEIDFIIHPKKKYPICDKFDKDKVVSFYENFVSGVVTALFDDEEEYIPETLDFSELKGRKKIHDEVEDLFV